MVGFYLLFFPRDFELTACLVWRFAARAWIKEKRKKNGN
jgi:hypothetical protein